MINLLYCGNKNAFDGVYVSLNSIVKHTKEKLCVYVLTMDLRHIKDNYLPISKNQIEYLEEKIKKINNESCIKLIDITDLFLKEMNNTVNMDSFYTPYCLLRLFADEIDEIPDKILYLDTDIMANNDIKELYDIDIEDYEFAGTRDFLGKFFIDYHYVNSGVLLLNMKEIRKTKLFYKSRYSCTHDKLAFPDQSALNLYVKKKKMISSKFNSQRFLKKNTVLQHFCKSIRFLPFYHTINVKPWDVENVHKKLKINAYDDVLNEYLEVKELIKSM